MFRAAQQLCRTAELPAGKGPLAANSIVGDQVSSTVPGTRHGSGIRRRPLRRSRASCDDRANAKGSGLYVSSR